jgi:hypothetical protein
MGDKNMTSLPLSATSSQGTSDQIEEAASAQLGPEARRAKAETRKLEVETLLLEKRLHTPWYRGRFLMEATVGAVVASSLVSAWLITYMQPILNRKQEIASLDAGIQAKVNESQRLENERRSEVLKQENKTIREQLASLSRLNSALQKQQIEAEKHASNIQRSLDAQVAELRRRANLGKSGRSDPQKLTELADKTQAASKTLGLQIAGLRAEQSITEARAGTLTSSLTANELRDTTWLHICESCDSGTRRLFLRLRGDGALGYNVSESSNFTFDGTDSWKVANGHLILSWTNGYSIENYPFPNPTSSKVEGTKSNVPGIVTIERHII